MRLSCLQDNLNLGLSVVGRALAARTTLPITQNVLLTTDRGQLKLSATNLEIAISTWVGASVEEEGAITVPARLLSEFINSLPQDKVDIAKTDQPDGVQIKCNRFEAHINGTGAEEFPPIPSVEDGVAARVTPQALKAAIGQVVFAAATEDSRPVLTGVKVELTGDQITLAAADGFRLAVHYGHLVDSVSETVAVIVPSKTLNEVQRLIGDQEEPVELLVTSQKSQMLFRLKNTEIVCQLVQGVFPNYAQLIPQGHTTQTVANLQAFQQATKTASIFARDGSGIVRLQIASGDDGVGKITVSARAEEVGENEGEVEAKVDGEDSKIAFNNKYLADVLSAIGQTEVVLETTNSSSPGVFRPVGSDEYVHVVMPMFVQW